MDHTDSDYYTIIGFLIMVHFAVVVMVIDQYSSSFLLLVDESCVTTAYSLAL